MSVPISINVCVYENLTGELLRWITIAFRWFNATSQILVLGKTSRKCKQIEQPFFPPNFFVLFSNFLHFCCYFTKKIKSRIFFISFLILCHFLSILNLFNLIQQFVFFFIFNPTATLGSILSPFWTIFLFLKIITPNPTNSKVTNFRVVKVQNLVRTSNNIAKHELCPFL